VDDDAPITGSLTTSRRAKYVSSRPVGDGEVVVYIPQPAPPASAHSPILEDLKDPDAPPAVDPTTIGLTRPYRHRNRYRFAQLATAASISATAMAVVTLMMSDRHLAMLIAAAALATGLIAVYLGTRSRLASRIVGYAIAAAALGAIALLLTLALPRHWFEERHPDQLPQPGDTRPSKPGS
jgi:hypothetical protein